MSGSYKRPLAESQQGSKNLGRSPVEPDPRTLLYVYLFEESKFRIVDRWNITRYTILTIEKSGFNKKKKLKTQSYYLFQHNNITIPNI